MPILVKLRQKQHLT